MCQFKSGIAVKISEDEVKIYTLKGEDSHTKIRKEYNIRDGIGAGASRQTPVELVPVRGLLKKEDYDFVFDAGKPDWWTDNMTVSAKAQLFSAIKAEIINNKIKYKGSLNLSRLTSLPKGITLKAGRYIYLNNLIFMSEGVTLEVGSSIELDSLTTLPKGITLKAGRYICLDKLTFLPKGVTLEAGWSIYLNSLTTLPKGIIIKSRNTFLKDKIIKRKGE